MIATWNRWQSSYRPLFTESSSKSATSCRFTLSMMRGIPGVKESWSASLSRYWRLRRLRWCLSCLCNPSHWCSQSYRCPCSQPCSSQSFRCPCSLTCRCRCSSPCRCPCSRPCLHRNSIILCRACKCILRAASSRILSNKLHSLSWSLCPKVVKHADVLHSTKTKWWTHWLKPGQLTHSLGRKSSPTQKTLLKKWSKTMLSLMMVLHANRKTSDKK